MNYLDTRNKVITILALIVAAIYLVVVVAALVKGIIDYRKFNNKP